MENTPMRTLIILSLVFVLSTSFSTSTDYYSEYTVDSFLNSGLADRELDPLSIDFELLNATVFFLYNQDRQAGKQKELTYSPELGKMLKAFHKEYEQRKFSNTERIKARLDKVAINRAAKLGYEGTLVVIEAESVNAVDHQKGKKFFYDRRDTKTELHLFYGDRDNRKGPVNYTSYRKVGEEVLRQLTERIHKQSAKSKAYKEMAIWIQLDYSSLYRNAIPQLKVLQAFGGQQMALLQLSNQ